MLEFKRILFPIDFSGRVRAAAPYAAAMAERFGAELTLLHVVESPLARPGELDFGALAFESDIEARTEHCRELLDSFLAERPLPFPVERRLEHGDPARTIVRIANETRADLIMMPTHGYGAFRRFILGSVTAKVLHDCDCAVWTSAHAETAPELDPAVIHNVVCAVDDTHAAVKPLRVSAALAGQFGARLTVTHAVPTSESVPERGMENEFRLRLIEDARRSLAERLHGLGIEAHLCIEGGEAAKVVRQSAITHKAELLVIGRGGHSGITGRLRTHSYAIIRESPCPVLSV